MTEYVEQHEDAINQIFSGSFFDNVCNACGKKGQNNTWSHCDAWTNWLNLGCGCNVHTCKECEDNKKANELINKLIDENTLAAEEVERGMLRAPTPDDLVMIRYYYFDWHECDKKFRDWVTDVIGEEKMQELLDVSCDCCGKPLSKPLYNFEDKNGNFSLKTYQEIWMYCYEVMGRDPQTSPFNMADTKAEDYNWWEAKKTNEIVYQTQHWHYYQCKGWDVNEPTDYEEGSHWQTYYEEMKDDETWKWHGQFIYHMPTKTYLGRFSKKGGDCAHIVELTKNQREQEEEILSAEFKPIYDDIQTNIPEGKRQDANKEANKKYFDKLTAIRDKRKWEYYCSNACRDKIGVANGPS